MTTKEILDTHGGEWLRWGVPMVFAAGMGWALLKTVPTLQEKVQIHDTRLAVIETQLDGIRDGIADIKDSLRTDRRARSDERASDLRDRQARR